MPAAVIEPKSTPRRQLPFRPYSGSIHGYATTDLLYEGDVPAGDGSVRRLPFKVPAGPLAVAILELMRIYEDVHGENEGLHREHERDQRQLSKLQGLIETLEKRIQGYESQQTQARKKAASP